MLRIAQKPETWSDPNLLDPDLPGLTPTSATPTSATSDPDLLPTSWTPTSWSDPDLLQPPPFPFSSPTFSLDQSNRGDRPLTHEDVPVAEQATKFWQS
jgi:hypothetical protein